MNIALEEKIDRFVTIDGVRVGEFKDNPHYQAFVFTPYVCTSLDVVALDNIRDMLIEVNS